MGWRDSALQFVPRGVLSHYPCVMLSPSVLHGGISFGIYQEYQVRGIPPGSKYVRRQRFHPLDRQQLCLDMHWLTPTD